MDNRFFLWAAVGLIWLMVYQAYQRDNAPNNVPIAPGITGEIEPGQLPDETSVELPTLPTTSDEAEPQLASVASSSAPAIAVETDVFRLKIDTAGAKLRDVEIIGFPEFKDKPDELITLLDSSPSALSSIQSGLIAAGSISAPNHDSRFTASQASYELRDGQDQLDVAMSWRNADGIVATKTFHFYRGRHQVDVDLTVENGTGDEFKAAPYLRVQRKQVPKKRSFTDVASYSFIGPVYYDGVGAEKQKPKMLRKEPIDESVTGGWLATIQHHFLTAAIPDPASEVRYRTRVTEQKMEVLDAVAPIATVESGSSKTFSHTLFVGPKLQSELADVAPGLIRTVDYGVLSIISQPLFWLLQKIHDVVGNWGWAIIFVTLFVKLLFYPLAEKGGRSMAKMRAIAPRMKSLQERYKDDRQALSKAMMELYKREKVNPMSSCLPMLLQLPVFFALYWVLIESVELRQAPWALWITDLSARDPYFVLPLIMAVAMFVQTKLNPPPADPTTAKVMQIMPIMMSVFFAFFPAGLVLYWVVNTVLSVLQQWRINRVVEAETKAKKA